MAEAVEKPATKAPLHRIDDAATGHDPAGERERLRLAFERCAERLYRYLLLRVGDRDQADDLLQQTCCEAAGGRIPNTVVECEAWLFGVARKLVPRHFRREKQRRRNPGGDPESHEWLARLECGEPPENPCERVDAIRRLALATSELSVEEQELLFAFYVEGRTQAVIADRLRTTAKGIEARLYRLRGRLRALLGGDGKVE